MKDLEMLEMLPTKVLKSIYRTFYCKAGAQGATKHIEYILNARGVVPWYNANGVLVKFIKTGEK